MRRLFLFAFILLSTLGKSQEHSVYRIASLKITGSTFFHAEAIVNSFTTKEGNIFHEATLENDINALLGRYADAGYTLAKVDIAHIIALDSVSLDVSLLITEGKRSRIERIEVIGLTSTDTAIVEREVRFATAGYYRRLDINDAAQRLRRLGIFTSVSEPEYYIISDSTVGIKMVVSEARTTTIDGIIGYIPAITPTQTAYVNGFAMLDFRNIGGTARRASFSYKHEAPRVQDIAAAYKEPWLFGVPLDLGVNFTERDEDSLFTRIGFGADLTAHLSSTTDIAVQGGYVSTIAGASKLVSGNNALATNLSVRFDHRDNIYAPRKGFDLAIGGGLFMKKITSQSIYDSAGQTATRLTQYSIDGSLYIPTFSLNQIFVASAHGKAFDAGDKTPDRSDLFRIGGSRSLRGFRESEFLVSFYIIGTVEYRFMLTDLSYIGIFADGASLASKGYFLSRTHPIGYGISLQFETAAGILSASVASASGDPIDQAKLHFGIATNF